MRERSIPYEKPSAIPEFPWQLTEGEWNYLREQVRPNFVQSRPTRSCKSIAIRRAKELEWLLYGICFEDRPVKWVDVMTKRQMELSV